jgi:hypothetical protein
LLLYLGPLTIKQNRWLTSEERRGLCTPGTYPPRRSLRPIRAERTRSRRRVVRSTWSWRLHSRDPRTHPTRPEQPRFGLKVHRRWRHTLTPADPGPNLATANTHAQMLCSRPWLVIHTHSRAHTHEPLLLLLTVNFRQPSYEFTFNVGIDLLF